MSINIFANNAHKTKIALVFVTIDFDSIYQKKSTINRSTIKMKVHIKMRLIYTWNSCNNICSHVNILLFLQHIFLQLQFSRIYHELFFTILYQICNLFKWHLWIANYILTRVPYEIQVRFQGLGIQGTLHCIPREYLMAESATGLNYIIS